MNNDNEDKKIICPVYEKCLNKNHNNCRKQKIERDKKVRLAIEETIRANHDLLSRLSDDD